MQNRPGQLQVIQQNEPISADRPLDNEQSPGIPHQLRSFMISGKNYTYDGPVNPEVQDLLDFLQEIQNREQGNMRYNMIIQKVKELDSMTQKKIFVSCDKLIISIVFTITFFAALAQSIDLSNSYVRGDSGIVQLLPLYVFLFTLATLCTTLFDFFKHGILWIISFPFLVIIPLLVLLSQLGAFAKDSTSIVYDMQSIAFTSLTLIIYACALACRFIVNWFGNRYHRVFGAIMVSQFCLLVPFGLILQCLLYVFGTQDLSLTNIQTRIAAPIFIGLFYVSLFALLRLFTIQPGEILDQLAVLKTKIKKFQLQNQLQETTSRDTPGFSTAQSRWIKLVTFILFSVIYIVLELTAYVEFISQFSEASFNIGRTIMFGLLMIFIPLHVILGTVIANSKTLFCDSCLWYPFLFSMFQVLATWADYQFQNQSVYQPISNLVLISPTLMGCLWGTVSYFKNKGYLHKFVVQTFCCYFVAFPLGFLWTISEGLNDSRAYWAVWAIVIAGSVPVGLFLAFQALGILKLLSQLPEQSEKINFSSYKEYNLNNYAAWLNAILYSLSYFSILYQVFYQPIGQSITTKGMLRGLLVLHPILFLIINVLIREKHFDLDDYESPDWQKGKQRQELLSRITLFFVIIPFVVLLPVALTLDEYEKQILLCISVGVPLLFGIFKLLIYIKNISGEYENFFQPFLIVLGWIFAILPFGVIIPLLANEYTKESTDFIYLAQVSVAYGLMFCICSVTGISLFFSILLNKEYLELKKRAVVTKLMELFTKYKISSAINTCSSIFMKHVIQQDYEMLKRDLRVGNPVNVLDYNGPNSNLYYQTLVTKRDFDNYHRQGRKKADASSGHTGSQDKDDQKQDDRTLLEKTFNCIASFGHMCVDCFFCRCGLEELEKEEQRLKDLELEVRTLEEQRMQQLNQFKLKVPDEEFQHRMKGDDFYGNLKLLEDRTERFWICVYNTFQNDIKQLLGYLQLNVEQSELEKFASFQQSGGKSLSVFDLAELMLKYITVNVKNPYVDLQNLAIVKYPLFLLNFPELKQKLRIKLTEETPFAKRVYLKSFKSVKLQQNSLARSLSQFQQAVDAQFQQHLDDIHNKYQSRLNPCQKKSFQLFKDLNYIFWVWPFNALQKLVNSTLDLLKFTVNQSQIQNIKQVQEKASWEVVSEEAAKTVEEESREFDKQMKGRNLQFKINFSNLLAAVLRLVDLFGLAALAFDNSVGWSDAASGETYSPSNYFVDWQIINLYYFHFFFALSLSILYAVLGRQAVDQISRNCFGLTQDGSPATWQNWSFWLSKLITIISGQFLYVMKTYIDAFVCNYDIPGDYRLYRNQDTVCMDSNHYLFVSLAFVGAFLYYPLSTFLQPTFQFSDHSLDLKYNSSYVVIYVQAKLLILGSTSIFFNLKKYSFGYQLIFAEVVIACLIYLFYKMWPCYVKWVNMIELGILGFIFSAYLSAIVIIFSGVKEAGWIIIIVASGGVFAIVLWKLWKYYDTTRSAVRINPQIEENIQVLKSD